MSFALRTLLCIFALTGTVESHAQAVRAAPSPELLKKVMEHNRQQRTQLHTNQTQEQASIPSVVRPVADYEQMKYLVFNSGGTFDSYEAKKALLANLPENVKVIILASNNDVNQTRTIFEGSIRDPKRLQIIEVGDSAQAFWARDALPVPVLVNEGTQTRLGATAALYYHGFSRPSQKTVAASVSSQALEHSYYYEGGNFEPDTKGNCLLVNHNTGLALPDDILKRSYGCKNVVRLPYAAGIGHVDEVVRILSPTLALTSVESYVPTLQSLGYDVRLLPKPAQRLETYANSLLLNGTVFVPVYGQTATEEAALQLYRDAGLKVVPINTSTLSNKGMGSIHCITMAYPDASSVDALLTSLLGPLKPQLEGFSKMISLFQSFTLGHSAAI